MESVKEICLAPCVTYTGLANFDPGIFIPHNDCSAECSLVRILTFLPHNTLVSEAWSNDFKLVECDWFKG